MGQVFDAEQLEPVRRRVALKLIRLGMDSKEILARFESERQALAAMNDVLQGEAGTARAVGRGAPYTMAGKSGTAQVFSVAQDETYDEEEVEERLRDHALFIAFAPLEDPRIAVAVVVENGSSGSRVAAPIARALMDLYLGHADDAV